MKDLNSVNRNDFVHWSNQTNRGHNKTNVSSVFAATEKASDNTTIGSTQTEAPAAASGDASESESAAVPAARSTEMVETIATDTATNSAPATKEAESTEPGSAGSSTPATNAKNSTSSASNSTQWGEITPMLHFIYVSPGFPDEQPPVPEHFLENVNNWQKLHPDFYQVKIWNNIHFKQEFPELARMLQNVTIMALASDLLRYHILEKYGGIYMDMDFAPIKSLEYLRTKLGPVFTGCELDGSRKNRLPTSPNKYRLPHYRYHRNKKLHGCLQLNNAVIGTVPHHPALQEIIKSALQSYKKSIENDPGFKYSLKVTGPKRWTKIVYQHEDVNILAKTLFYPCLYGQRDHCDPDAYRANGHVFGMHEWKGSWKKGGKGLDGDSQR